MFREFVVAKQRRADEHDRDVAMSWRTVALDRHKKLPKLETLLSKHRSSRQSAAEQRGMLNVLSAQYGIPLRARRRKH